MGSPLDSLSQSRPSFETLEVIEVTNLNLSLASISRSCNPGEFGQPDWRICMRLLNKLCLSNVLLNLTNKPERDKFAKSLFKITNLELRCFLTNQQRVLKIQQFAFEKRPTLAN